MHTTNGIVFNKFKDSKGKILKQYGNEKTSQRN